jgi:hypothetical protein
MKPNGIFSGVNSVRMNKKTRLNKLIVSIVFFSLFFLLLYALKEASPNHGDAKLTELQELSYEIPKYPSFTNESTHYSSRYSDAGVYKYYSSTADFKDVEVFYSSVLAQRGFSLDGEDVRKIIFRKGDTRIIIEFAGDKSDQSWNYGVTFSWK